MKYEVVIGLEVHVELATASKLFCSCGAHAKNPEPNSRVCPACCGMPGMLPVTNRHAVELAVMAGTLLNCQINRYSSFDKKSYYYPDLPCAYQITQWFHPICTKGKVTVETKNGVREIGIKQIHVEEDAGKLVHDEWTDTSMVDFNRTSVPLIEIVSLPDFRSGEEVLAYLEKLKKLFRFARISECEDGAMRCDVNLSIRPEGSTELGVRTEMKNMSSFVSISKAIEYEIARHIDALERHTEELIQETRRWDDTKNRSFSMRNKETAADYRYFPDPNLMPVIIDDEWYDRIIRSMPAPAEQKFREYVDAGIAEKDAEIITSERTLCDILDKVISLGAEPKEAANWLITECASVMRRNGKVISDLEISPEKLYAIISMVSSGKINRGAGKKILIAVIDNDVDPEAYCAEMDMNVQDNADRITEVAKKVIEENEAAVKDYRSGKTKAFQALVGAAMRELKGNGDPAVIREKLLELLGE